MAIMITVARDHQSPLPKLLQLLPGRSALPAQGRRPEPAFSFGRGSRQVRSVSKSLLIGGLMLITAVNAGDIQRRVEVDDSSFKCMTEMTHVRHFYVDNLSGNLAGTVAVAKAGRGEYPQGSVLQLVPNEVMVKQQKGFSPVTRDWEFFFIDVSPDGSKIYKRGFAEVNNRFGQNCFACHVKAKPEFDFVCEQDHGCDPIPVTRAMSGALQRSDPRCKNRGPVSAEDAEALKQLGEIVKALTGKTN